MALLVVVVVDAGRGWMMQRGCTGATCICSDQKSWERLPGRRCDRFVPLNAADRHLDGQQGWSRCVLLRESRESLNWAAAAEALELEAMRRFCTVGHVWGPGS
jgi:hypothetical protein